MMRMNWLANVALAAGMGWGVSHASAQIPQVRVTVNVKSDADHKYGKPKGETGKVKTLLQTTYTKQLEMTVKSFAAKKLEGVVVKYWMFAHDLDAREVQPAQAGHELADLEPMKSVTLESKSVNLVYDAHKHGGKKYAGCVVQVFSNDKKIAEVCDPRDMLKDFQKLLVDEEAVVVPAGKKEKKKNQPAAPAEPAK